MQRHQFITKCICHIHFEGYKLQSIYCNFIFLVYLSIFFWSFFLIILISCLSRILLHLRMGHSLKVVGLTHPGFFCTFRSAINVLLISSLSIDHVLFYRVVNFIKTIYFFAGQHRRDQPEFGQITR